MKCEFCLRKPSEIEDYIVAADECDLSPNEYVKKEEGSYNRSTKTFCCPTCYSKMCRAGKE